MFQALDKIATLQFESSHGKHAACAKADEIESQLSRIRRELSITFINEANRVPAQDSKSCNMAAVGRHAARAKEDVHKAGLNQFRDSACLRASMKQWLPG